MYRGRSLDVIVTADILRAPWAKRYASASLVAELVDAFCEPDLALPDVYDLLLGAVGAIAVAAAPRSLLPRFCLRLLEMLGLAPPLTTCIRCGEPLRAGQLWLDAQSGGIVDTACAERWRDLPELEERDVESLRALALPRGEATAAALNATPAAAGAVQELVAHHLGRRPKSLAHLGTFGA